jgi:Metallo-peptidase family M12
MRFPPPLALALIAAVIAAGLFWRIHTFPVEGTEKSRPDTAGQADQGTASDPAHPSGAATYAPTAAEYRVDAPRRRNELGQVLPFREQRLDTTTAQLLRQANVGQVVGLELFPDINFVIRLTGRWDDKHGTRLAGKIQGQPDKDSFFMSWYAGGARGLLELPSRNLAYELLLLEDGSYMAREWLYKDIICATPSPDGTSADAGMPSPLGGGGNQSSPSFIAPGDVPALRSRPGVNRVVYLDFDGETVTSFRWANGSTIVAQPARLSAAQITEVWDRVVRDFEPFDVNITTVRSDYDNAPDNRKIHCVITDTDTAAPGAGGVAYVDAFRFSDVSSKVCWAFIDNSVKSCAEVISHEIGHTMGLRHDGRSATSTAPAEEYYGGHGSGETGWAPIMGVGYSRQLTQWSKGEYNRANNPEDDLAIMSDSRRIPYVSDDHGDTSGLATAVSGNQAAGLVGRTTDIDFWRVDLAAGNHTVNLQPAAFGNVDLELQVFNQAGVQIGSGNFMDTLATYAFFSLEQPQTVYLRVSGAGNREPSTTGYSSYASLGSYTLTGFGNQQQPPSPPIGVAVTRISGTMARVTWNSTPGASYYAVYRDAVLLATVVGNEFVDTGLRPSSNYNYTIRAGNQYGSSSDSTAGALTTPAADEFVMDGQPDFAGYLVSNPGMTIYAAVRGRKLYVSTWSPGNWNSGYNNDHLIIISDSLLASVTTPAHWSKSGFMAIPAGKPFLAGESTTDYAGWFNTQGETSLFKAPESSGALEGVIDLVACFGAMPAELYIAAIAYQTEDAISGDTNRGKISSQAPSGNGNNNIEPQEFFRIPVRAVRDAAQNGTYDILDATRSFAVTNVSFNASNRPVLRWPVVPGKNYMVQGRSDFTAGSWSNLLTTNWGAGPTQWEMEFTDTAAPAATKFYRVTQP